MVARSAAQAERFTRDHQFLKGDLTVELGQRSYFELLQAILTGSDERYACVVHDDVMLCQDFPGRLDALVHLLNERWPSWGLAGNAGVLPFGAGYSSSQVVRFLADGHGGPNLSGHVLPAQSIDGNVMLLNLAALRSRELTLPAFHGFHLYDLILSIETLRARLAVLVVPHLACWHGSMGSQPEFDRAVSGAAFRNYCQERIANRRITTINGCVDAGVSQADPMALGRIDMEMESLRVAARGRPPKSVGIVTRTQFRRPALLQRALRSIRSFVAAAGTATDFQAYAVTDVRLPHGHAPLEGVELLQADLPEGSDNRFRLVRFAAENINADYLWFVDDDDWLFPNEAERVSLVVNAAPDNAILFVGCQHFEETASGDGESMSYSSRPGRLFPAGDFLASLSGENYTPFCGALLPRSALLAIPGGAYEAIVYFEDFYTVLNAILECNCLPLVIDVLCAGISLRTPATAGTGTDRTPWDRSMSELVSRIANSPHSAQLLSLPPGAWTSHWEQPAEPALRSIVNRRLRYMARWVMPDRVKPLAKRLADRYLSPASR